MPARVRRRKTNSNWTRNKSSKAVSKDSSIRYKPYQNYKLPDLNREKPNIFLFDSDDFYGLTLDLVLFNFDFDSAIKIGNSKLLEELENSLKGLNEKEISNSVVVLDQLFLENNEKVEKVIEKLKQVDPNSEVIFTTTLADPESKLKNKFDHIVVKSSRASDYTLIEKLSEILGVEFVADNSDPELE